jgi:hypothetical protein
VIIHFLEGFAVVSTIAIVSLLAALLLGGLLRSASASSQGTEAPCFEAEMEQIGPFVTVSRSVRAATARERHAAPSPTVIWMK